VRLIKSTEKVTSSGNVWLQLMKLIHVSGYCKWELPCFPSSWMRIALWYTIGPFSPSPFHIISPPLSILNKRSRGSSVSIMSDYELDDRAIGVRSPAEAKDFSSNLCVQTGCGSHPASCTMGTGGPFLGVKRGRGVTLTTHRPLVPRSRMSRSYICASP
jgi:hypothetical protein